MVAVKEARAREDRNDKYLGYSQVSAEFSAKLALTWLWPAEKITLADSKNWRRERKQVSVVSCWFGDMF